MWVPDFLHAPGTRPGVRGRLLHPRSTAPRHRGDPVALSPGSGESGNRRHPGPCGGIGAFSSGAPPAPPAPPPRCARQRGAPRLRFCCPIILPDPALGSCVAQASSRLGRPGKRPPIQSIKSPEDPVAWAHSGSGHRAPCAAALLASYLLFGLYSSLQEIRGELTCRLKTFRHVFSCSHNGTCPLFRCPFGMVFWPSTKKQLNPCNSAICP